MRSTGTENASPSQPKAYPATDMECEVLVPTMATMCSPVGWAGNVSESICFRIKINTILAEDHFGFFLAPDQAATLRKRLSASRYVFWTHFRAKGLRF